MSYNDSCFGSGTIYWSDDSYAQGGYDCPGCSHEKCPAKNKEVLVPPSIPSDAGVTVKVQIPVAITNIGQRDQAEVYTRAMTVEFDGSRVTLRSDPPTQSGTDTVSFPWAGIEAAIGVLGSLK